MDRLKKTIEINEEIKNIFLSSRRKQIWLIITEGRSGNTAQNIPGNERHAAESDVIKTCYILRD